MLFLDEDLVDDSFALDAIEMLMEIQRSHLIINVCVCVFMNYGVSGCRDSDAVSPRE